MLESESITGPDGSFVIVRIGRPYAGMLATSSAEVGLTPDEWVSNLVRARLERRIPWRAGDLDAMADAASSLLQIREMIAGSSDAFNSVRDQGDLLLARFLARVHQAAQLERDYWRSADAEPAAAVG